MADDKEEEVDRLLRVAESTREARLYFQDLEAVPARLLAAPTTSRLTMIHVLWYGGGALLVFLVSFLAFLSLRPSLRVASC